MNIRFVDPDRQLTPSWRELFERRIWFALSRFQSRIHRVVVTVCNEKGKREGVEKVCRISVYFKEDSNIVIDDRDTELGVCLSHAASRAGRTVARHIAKMVEERHSRTLRGTSPLSAPDKSED